MSNRRGTQFFRTLHKEPWIVDCNFIVDPANGSGKGVRSLKGAGIQSVHMNSTASFVATYNNSVNLTAIPGGTASLVVGMHVQGTGIPAGATIASIVSSSAITISAATTGGAQVGATVTYQSPNNPNPGAGVILVGFQDNYKYYIGGFSGFVSPVSGTPILVTTGVTAGLTYTIVSVGTTSLAQWQKLGLPIGIKPAVGATFVAPLTTTATGTGAIEVPLSTGSGIDHIEALGDPNATIQSSSLSVGKLGGPSGAYLLFQCFASTVATAPAANSVVGMSFYFSNSEITVNGY